jgi:hypothetical protein
MGEPVRLQLSRRKGFNLQALSQATNGLPAVKVSRPGPWGNPFLVHPNQQPGRRWGLDYTSVPTAEDAVACFREMLETPGEPGQRSFEMRGALSKLRGKNLACWCKVGEPCHADVLLELANRPVCDAPSSPAVGRGG